MRICIYGAGAVGGHMAAKLAARSGEEVSVVARGANLAAMREKGVTLLHGDETIRGKVRATDRAAELGPQDVVFVTLKANALDAFADAAAPLLGPRTSVVFVQNGIPWWYAKERGTEAARLDPGGSIARAIAPERVLAGVAYSSNELVEPGVIRNFVPGNNMFVLGEPDNQDSARVQSLRKVLEKCDMASPAVSDIRLSIWAKLSQNLGTSTIATLTGGTLDVIRGDSGLARLVLQAGAEARAIAAGVGVRVDQAPLRPAGGHGSGMHAHKPSMLQDYERGKPMEIDAQLTAPLAMARSAGVATPTLDALVALVVYKATAKGLYKP